RRCHRPEGWDSRGRSPLQGSPPGGSSGSSPQESASAASKTTTKRPAHLRAPPAGHLQGAGRTGPGGSGALRQGGGHTRRGRGAGETIASRGSALGKGEGATSGGAETGARLGRCFVRSGVARWAVTGIFVEREPHINLLDEPACPPRISRRQNIYNDRELGDAVLRFLNDDFQPATAFGIFFE